MALDMFPTGDGGRWEGDSSKHDRTKKAKGHQKGCQLQEAPTRLGDEPTFKSILKHTFSGRTQRRGRGEEIKEGEKQGGLKEPSDPSPELRTWCQRTPC